MLVSVKMSNGNGFPACYYVGEFEGFDENRSMILNTPVRFIENFVPVEKEIPRIIKTGQAQKTSVLEPVVQDVVEAGMSRARILIPITQLLHYGEIEDSNPELVDSYKQVLAMRQKAGVNPKEQPQARIEAVN